MSPFSKTDSISGWHVKLLIYVISALFGVTMSMVIYIWNDQQSDQKKIDKQQNDLMEKYFEDQKELSLRQKGIIQYLSNTDKVDLEGILNQIEWQRLIEKYKRESNTRGGDHSSRADTLDSLAAQ